MDYKTLVHTSPRSFTKKPCKLSAGVFNIEGSSGVSHIHTTIYAPSLPTPSATVMKIYCAHSSSFDFETDYYQPLSRLSEAHGHEVILPHRNPDVMRNSKETIRTCDLVVAEVSFPSTGMGIESGWAESFNIPILAIHRTDTTPSSSIKAVARHVLPYDTIEDITDAIRSYEE